MFLVLMPRLQTNMHLPHIMHFFTFCKASFSLPLCNIRIICRKLTSVKLPAVQVAVHNPHDIHVLMSGLSDSNLLNNFKSTLSILICELFDMLKPKSIIVYNLQLTVNNDFHLSPFNPFTFYPLILLPFTLSPFHPFTKSPRLPNS